ncbi:hypothetical protein IMZ48_19865 [Candidatus Bathyarchaeota archaeon]|nr:hypothetical protein [Candidatus Bathyarchaeota archaeon]
MTVSEFRGAAHEFLMKYKDKDPGLWEFEDLKRKTAPKSPEDQVGSFEDEDLVKLLQAGAENVGGMPHSQSPLPISFNPSF